MTLERLDTVIAFVALLLGISLLITILTQMIGSLLGYRGAYLKDGLVEMLVNLNPQLKDEAQNLIEKVLANSTASDSIFWKWAPKVTGGSKVGRWFLFRWRRATALRPEELARLLQEVSTSDGAVKALIDEIVAAKNPEIDRQARALLQTVKSIDASLSVTADEIVKQLAGKANQAVTKLDAWFNSTMDRVSQRYTLQMRLWTVVFAVLIAVAAHLNAFKLYSQLASDPTQRSALVGSAQTLLQKAADALPTDQSVPGVYKSQMKQLQDQQAAVKALGEPPDFRSRGEADDWLLKNIADKNQAKEAVDQYDKMLEDALMAAGQKLSDQYKEVNQALSSAGIQLWPSPYPGFPKQEEIPGILAMAGLLSLGAPFWFNALKTLSNLRPVLATKTEG